MKYLIFLLNKFNKQIKIFTYFTTCHTFCNFVLKKFATLILWCINTYCIYS